MKVRTSSFAAAALTAFAAIALVLPTAARATDIAVPLTETKVGGTETLSVSGYPGATIGGTPDNWTITFPGIILITNYLPMAWAEGLGDTGFNDLSLVNTDTLRLVSEAATFTSKKRCVLTLAPLPLGMSCLIGMRSGNFYYARITETTAAVPEPASLAVFGTALLGLGLIGRRRNRAQIA